MTKLAAVFVTITGCGLVWDVDSYRGSDARVDASDIDPDPDASMDAGPDSTTDAADVDVPTDVLSDVLVDTGGSCSLLNTPAPVTLGAGESLINAIITHSDPGPALVVDGADAEIRNVEIVLQAATSSGVLLTAAADRAMVSNVRVRHMVEVPDNSAGLEIRGTTDDGVVGVRLMSFETHGLVSVQIDHAEDVQVVGVRAHNPRSNADFLVEKASAIFVRNSTNVRVTDFGIVSSRADEEALLHAIFVGNSDGISFSSGFVGVRTSNFAVRVQEGEGIRASEMSMLDITGSRTGVEFERANGWTLTDVEVVRRGDCVIGDYAFANRSSAVIECEGCTASGPCLAGAALGMAVSVGDGVGSAPPPLEHCFVPTF